MKARSAKADSSADKGADILTFVQGDAPGEMTAICRGGPSGAALLYDRFGPVVDRIVWRLLGSDDEHDDLVHQVFCELLAGVHRVRQPAALPGWVRRVTANVVCSELRHRRVRRLWSRTESDPDRFQGEIADPALRRLFRRVYAVLERMPAKEQVALCLRHFEGLTIEELADACSCSKRTINRRLANATRRFQRLAKQEPELTTWLHEARAEGRP